MTFIPSTKGALAAEMLEPKEKTGRLAILCPGFLDTKNYPHLAALAKMLARDGYTVVRFDPTGTWESEGDITDYTTTQYLQDIKNVLTYMQQRGQYPHVLLGGHSRGGMVSLLYAAQDKRISFVLGIMPSSGRTMTQARRAQWKKTGVSISQRDVPNKKTKKVTFRVPYAHVKDRDQYNVNEAVKKINVPVLLLAGSLDKLCSPKDTQQLYDHANKPKKFIIIDGIGHNYRHNAAEIKIVNDRIRTGLNALKNKNP